MKVQACILACMVAVGLGGGWTLSSNGGKSTAEAVHYVTATDTELKNVGIANENLTEGRQCVTRISTNKPDGTVDFFAQVCGCLIEQASDGSLFSKDEVLQTLYFGFFGAKKGVTEKDKLQRVFSSLGENNSNQKNIALIKASAHTLDYCGKIIATKLKLR